MSTMRVLAVVVGLAVCVASAVQAFPEHAPTIPDGYSGKVVLRVGYGRSYGQVGVDWGNDGTAGEYQKPRSVEQMQVVGDLFYMHDGVRGKLKLFQSPGTCVWESQVFTNMLGYAVSPKGTAYLVWGDGHEKLSCIDARGQTLWTRNLSEVVPPSSYPSYGFEEIVAWCGIDWTFYGLTATFCVSPKGGGQKFYQLQLNDDGYATELLSREHSSFGPDGTAFAMEGHWGSGQTEWSARRRDKAGNDIGAKRFQFDADNGKHLAGAKEMGMRLPEARPSGDFAVHGKAFLDQKYQSGVVTRGLDEVLWRFDSNGRFKEQWRFLSPQFAHLGSMIVIGTDELVYHLQFTKTGIEVVQYSPKK